jgi:hypothetical protein
MIEDKGKTVVTSDYKKIKRSVLDENRIVWYKLETYLDRLDRQFECQRWSQFELKNCHMGRAGQF